MPRIFTFGETVYDIIFKNAQPVAAKAGGSMLNTSVSLGRLGLDVNFVSDMGMDNIGDTIMNFLIENGISTKYIERYPNFKSSLAIAFLNRNNDASYTFYKDFPEIRLASVDPGFEEGDIVLFGSFFALTGNLRPVLKKFLFRAKEKNCIIIYDPNFRRPHLPELEKLKPFIMENISMSDLVRGSDEDFNLVFGASGAEDAFNIINENGCRNLVYTASSNDLHMISRSNRVSFKIPLIEPVSTIGAGDSFNAGLIWTLIENRITKKKLMDLPVFVMEKMLANGASFAAEVCMSYDNYISKIFAAKIKKPAG